MDLRTFIIRSVTFLAGLYFFLEFVLPENIGTFKFGTYHEEISNSFLIIGIMAIGLGLWNLLRLHGGKVTLLKKGWQYSAALLIGLFLMIGITALDWQHTSQIASESSKTARLADFATHIIAGTGFHNQELPPREYRFQKLAEAVTVRQVTVKSLINRITQNNSFDKTTSEQISHSLRELNEILDELPKNIVNTDSALKALSVQLFEIATLERRLRSLEYSHHTNKRIYSLFFDSLFISLGSAMFALLGFYIAAAAYRAFRIRSFESGLMLLAAVIVMLGQIPFGLWLYSDLPSIRLWLMEVPSAAAFRAIKFGASIALLGMALRMWLSIESTSFHRKKEG